MRVSRRRLDVAAIESAADLRAERGVVTSRPSVSDCSAALGDLRKDRFRRSSQASKRARCGPSQSSDAEVVSPGGRRGCRSPSSGRLVLAQCIVVFAICRLQP